MSRDDFEIPEAFRRAMEEAGWGGNRNRNNDDDGDGGDGNGGRRPFPERTPSGPNRPAIIIGILFALFIASSWLIGVYTDWLWFIELGYVDVWVTQWSMRFGTFAIFFAIALLVLLLNWRLARRRAIRVTQPFQPQFLTFRPISWLINGIALLLAFGFGSAASDQWEELLLYINRTPFGMFDPIFGQEVSFYLFELPIYEFLQGWILGLLLVTLLGILPIYAINNAPEIQRGQWRPDQMPVLRQHIALIGGLFLLSWAVGHGLDIFNLMYSTRSNAVGFGPSYTDMNASIYALYAQAALMGLTAVFLLFNLFRLNLRLPLIGAGAWLLTTLVLGGVYPGLLQRYAVEPNEIVRETPYIENNIEFTRRAFDLDTIETRPFDNVRELRTTDLTDNEAVLRNVRLWDYRPLQQTYGELQALRPYYQFSDIDIDRYTIDGELRQVMLAARELNKGGLQAPSWVNLNLEFTHGYGIVMNLVDQVSRDGLPIFAIKDLPPESDIGIDVDRPEVYYGELTNDTVFVGSVRDEFSYPSGDDNVYTSYAGTGGVPMDSYFKRVAFSLRLADVNVLLSDEIDGSTRVQYYRQIQERVSEITPFLSLDGDPYLVVTEGRLVWIQDAYTTSNRFPYATPVEGSNLNYVRNTVKIVIDAYNGSVDYYLADNNDDPIIRAYEQIFPTLFQPFSELPEGLFQHIRYPEGLFRIQTQQYLTYHMTDVRVFYNREDVWEIPKEVLTNIGEQDVEPYYVILTLPGEEEPEYLLIQPVSPVGKPNMIAWVAARNDGESYGELIVYELPKQELVFGPIQIEGRIDQDTDISQQISLWNQQGSEVIRGNLIVIPLNDSFLYVEPIYLRSQTNPLPELKRVIVASDSRIAMRETLDGALSALLLDDAPPIVLDNLGGESTVELEAAEPPETDAPTGGLIGDETVAELIEAANSHFEAAEAAQQAGDWATYGDELEQLEEVLAQLLSQSQ